MGAGETLDMAFWYGELLWGMGCWVLVDCIGELRENGVGCVWRVLCWKDCGELTSEPVDSGC